MPTAADSVRNALPGGAVVVARHGGWWTVVVAGIGAGDW